MQPVFLDEGVSALVSNSSVLAGPGISTQLCGWSGIGAQRVRGRASAGGAGKERGWYVTKIRDG